MVIKEETGTTFTESDDILGKWKRYGDNMVNVSEIQDVEQEEETESRLPEDVEQGEETESRVPEADIGPLRSDVEWAITHFERRQITWQITWH